ncbi:hypothetical protein [Nocardiopsis sp. MG754419]|uniref:hypothetical protein n=1 Tax=Nocardiopsis sp. MG754419 TaxID=2259865 RepID=UPI001BAD07A4|nr:hypothetical protein [Nocardiopsis sp. MG754419]
MPNERSGGEGRPDLIERLARSSFLSYSPRRKFPERPTRRQWIDIIIGVSLSLLVLLGLTVFAYVRGQYLGVAVFSVFSMLYFSIWILPMVILSFRLRKPRE